MAKRNYGWSKEKLDRYLREGRGKGELEHYKPWLKINDFSSMGRASRIKGWKTNRVHHLQSDIMTGFFYLLEWDDRVQDIRETFPLLDAFDELSIDEDLDFNLFKNTENKEQYVLTTSFLITTYKEEKKEYFARSIKNSYELEKKTTLEKLEIERRYWNRKGIDWALITEKEIPINRVKNIEWVHNSFFDNVYSGEMLDEKLLKYINNNINMPLKDILEKFDEDNMFEEGTSLSIFKYLISCKRVDIDMDIKIDLKKEIKNIINVMLGGERDVNDKFSISS